LFVLLNRTVDISQLRVESTYRLRLALSAPLRLLHIVNEILIMTINDKRQHNLRLPIYRIPNEILSKIFCDLRSNYIRVRHGLKDWITVTHVCHAWREVALNTSLLWCHIDFLSVTEPNQVHAWIPELLRRSKQSPLTLTIRPEHGTLKQLKLHFGRVRELVLDTPSEETLREVFVSKFQNLEVLEVSDDFRFARDLEFILDDSHVRAGCIRHLALHSCSVDGNSKFLQGLTHLRLADIPDDCRFGCHDFLLVLSKIPRLEIIDLCGFIKEADEGFKAAKVHLLHLRELSVQCLVPKMAQFLPCLVVPRSCKLDIHTGDESEEMGICDNFRAILSWVSNQLRVPTTPLPTSNAGEQYIRSFLLLDNPHEGDFTVEGYSDVLSHEQMETADPILKFVFFWAYDEERRDNSFSLQKILSLLPLEGLVSLDVITDFNVYLPPEFWMVAFGSIQTLNEIYLETTTSNFWKALALTNSAVKSLSFPALTSITVDDHLLKSRRVLDKLRIRSELGGTQLQSLVFAGVCRVPPRQVISQLGEWVSSIQAVESSESRSADETEDDSSSTDSDGWWSR